MRLERLTAIIAGHWGLSSSIWAMHLLLLAMGIGLLKALWRQ
jgi:hypothetical protein